jgi:hypothetical protein
MAEQESKMDESTGGDETASRLAGDPNSGAPTSPEAAHPSTSGISQTINQGTEAPAGAQQPDTGANPMAEQDSESERALRAQLLQCLQGFAVAAESVDPAAFEAVNAIAGGSLSSLVQLLAAGTQIKAGLEDLDAQQHRQQADKSAAALLLQESERKLNAVTAQVLHLQGEKESAANAESRPSLSSLLSPFMSRSTWGGNTSSTSATSMAAPAIYIQQRTVLLDVPLTNSSVRGFRTWGIQELKEGRPVQYGTLLPVP